MRFKKRRDGNVQGKHHCGDARTQRILRVQDLWDSIATEPEAIELTEWQKEELDRRLESYRRNPDDWQPWHEVLAEIRNRR